MTLRLTIVHADGLFKVLKNGDQIRVPMNTGRTLPVEFEAGEAAAGYVRIYRIIAQKRSRSRA